ncbi:MAG TPA: hypothetical protein VHG51_16635 [Longimicrobiaceae bacterium]|nr:hypothetical protein [Longimicrobiaceae bacterium]
MLLPAQLLGWLSRGECTVLAAPQQRWGDPGTITRAARVAGSPFALLLVDPGAQALERLETPGRVEASWARTRWLLLVERDLLRLGYHLGAFISSLDTVQDGLVVLLPWSAPPTVDRARNDEVVRSFACARATLAAALAGDRAPQETCFTVLSSVLARGGEVPRLTVHQLGKPGPQRGPRKGEVQGAQEPTVGAIVPHRGDLGHLRTCLHYLDRQERPVDAVDVCFDEEVGEPHAGLMRERPGSRFFVTAPTGVGPYVARRERGENAPEELMLFQDSDDASCTNRLACLLDVVREFPGALVGSHTIELDLTAALVRAVRFPLDVRRALAPGPRYSQLHGTTIVPRESFRRIGGFSTAWKVAADEQFLLRAFFRIPTIRNADEFLYVTRLRPDSLIASPETGMRSALRQELWPQWRRAFYRVRDGQERLEDSPLRVVDRTPAAALFRLPSPAAHEEMSPPASCS